MTRYERYRKDHPDPHSLPYSCWMTQKKSEFMEKVGFKPRTPRILYGMIEDVTKREQVDWFFLQNDKAFDAFLGVDGVHESGDKFYKEWLQDHGFDGGA